MDTVHVANDSIHYLHHCLFFFCSQSCRFFLLLSKSSSVWVRPVLGGWMGGWGSVRSLLWLYDIFISYHSYLHLCHHYLHHCLFFFCSQSCRIFLIVEQESISLGQTGARWVDGWMREHGHCYGYMIYLYLIVLIYIYVIIIYIIVYSFLFPILQDFFIVEQEFISLGQTGARWSCRFTCRFTRPIATSSPVCRAGRLRKVWWLQMDLWFWHWTNFTLAVPQCIQDSIMWLVHTGLDYLDYFPQ